MITTVTTAFKRAIGTNSRSFELYFVDRGGNKFDIAKASFTLPYSPNTFRLGAISSSSIDCEVLTNSLVKNQTVWLKIKEKSVNEEVSLREFKITEAKRMKSTNQPMMRIVAYDRLSFIKLEEGNVYSSTGLKKISEIWLDMFRKTENPGFSSQSGVSAYTGRFKDVVVDSSIFSGYNIRDAMSFLASYVGANIIMSNTGRYVLKELTPYDYGLLNYNRIAEPQLDEKDTFISYLVAKKSDTETLTSGSTTSGEGLVITNPAMTQEVLNDIFENLPNKYRVANIDYVLADPTLEPGDYVPLHGADGEYVGHIAVMEMKFTFDGGLSCRINSNKPDQNEQLTLAEKISFSTKSATDSKKYAEAAIDFSEAMAQGMGMRVSTKTDSTGATIYYLHDEPDLEKSTRIWKVTSEGIGFATAWQGDDTVFIMGVNSKGNIITNMLTVYKINADMIDAGAVTADKIGAGAITTDKIDAGAVTADKIKVDDLNAVSAQIGTFKIGKFTLYRPSQPSEDAEENFNYGFGLSGTSYAFYAGYLSNSSIYNPEATNPGSPYEQDGTFKKNLVNLYIHRNGTLGLKNVVFYDSYYSTERGGMKLESDDSDTKIRLYANKIGFDSDGKEKVEKISSYVVHANPLTNSRTNKEYQHEFEGRTLFNNGIIVEDSTDGSFVDSPRYNISTTYSNNLQATYRLLWVYKDSNGIPTAVSLGSDSNSIDTRIYAGTNNVIRMMNDVYIRNNTGIYFGIGTSGGSTIWNNMFHCDLGIDENGTNALLYIGDPNRRINTDIHALSLNFKTLSCRSTSTYYVFENAVNIELPSESKITTLVPKIEGGQTRLDLLSYNSTGLHLSNSSTNIYVYNAIYHSSNALMLNVTSSNNLIVGDTDIVAATYLRAKNNIRCEASMRFVSGKGISLSANSSNSSFDMALYRSVSSSDLQGVGVYVGVEGVPLWLRGDIYSTKYTTPILKVSSSNNLVLGDTGQGGRTYIYSKSTPMMWVSNSNNLIIGSDSSPIGETYIYSKNYIFAKSNLRMDNGKGFYVTNDGNTWYRVIYHASSSDAQSTGLHIGNANLKIYFDCTSASIDSLTSEYLITEDVFTYSVQLYEYGSEERVPAAALQWGNFGGYNGVHVGMAEKPSFYWGTYHRFLSTLRVPSISFDVNGTWRAAAQYGNKTHSSGEVRTGFHFGIATFNTYIWGTPFLSNGVSITSDKNLKNTIEDLADNYESLFYKLNAKTFKYNDGTSDRKHIGFIAQEVKDAIDNSGLTTQDVGAYVADTNQADGSELLALRYSEFVALNTHMIQKCLAKISSLEDEIKLLKETIKNG